MPTLGTLAAGIRSVANTKRGQVYLIETDEGRPLRSFDALIERLARDPAVSVARAFQYFPESLTDTKAVNWTQKEVPGGSLPIYQYANSGERTISFTVPFTTDVDHYAYSNSSRQRARVEATRARLQASGQADRNVFIPAAIAWLRRFMLPSYGENSEIGVPFTRPPRQLLLVIPGSNIHVGGGAGGFSTANGIHCIMTQCDVTYEAFFPSGNPRIATVSLAFAEIPQQGGAIRFPQVTSDLDAFAHSHYPFPPREGPGTPDSDV